MRKVLTGKDINFATLQTDQETNRNSKMIQTLMRKDVNGMFLFYMQKDNVSIDQGFILPPGLNEEEVNQFKFEFMTLFERYAKLANKQSLRPNGLKGGK